MSEVRFAVGDGDAGLAERLDEEISAFNAAATGHHDARMLSVAVHGDGGDLRVGLYGWIGGGCGYIELLSVRDGQRGHRRQAPGHRRSRDPAPRLRPSGPEHPLVPGAGFLRPVRLHRMRPHAGLPAWPRRHPMSERTLKCVTRIPSLGAGNWVMASAPSSGVPRRCRRTGRRGFVPRARPPRRGLVRRTCPPLPPRPPTPDWEKTLSVPVRLPFPTACAVILPTVSELAGGCPRTAPGSAPPGPSRPGHGARLVCGQESRARMSSASTVVPNALPSSSTLENSLAFLAFSAMTFSSMVSLATRR